MGSFFLILVYFVMFPDSLGSGDDDEDNGLEDSSAEIENDQVYFSRGVFFASFGSSNTWYNRTSRLHQNILTDLCPHRSLLDPHPAHGEEAVRCSCWEHSEVSLSGHGQPHAEHPLAQKWT